MVINIVVILGKSCAGKNAVVDKLVKEHNFKAVVPYTTRPPRESEIQGITYHHISEDEFLRKVNDDFFAEWSKYETKSGCWYYGSSKECYEEQSENSVIILNPTAHRKLLSIGYDLKSIYIYANNDTIRKRMTQRKDDQDESERRFFADAKDFKGLEREVDKIVYNNNGTNINSVVDSVLFCLEKMNERGAID